MSISHSTLSNRHEKVNFFLPLHDFFVVSSKSRISKNSKFKFLEPKSTIKGGLRVSTKDPGNKQENPIID
ncbi:hypothetical protein H5410_056332 [Solanum commersonii]|uniref:Uncharacterized protein n=1 Tax=Solanum commersonii TaxID=4109 RepID=A0A9J5WMT4_SOLCO|nr:hypothetical protein H5410_056332 [Solanum commersonii]